MSLDVIHDHFSGIMNKKIDSLISKAVLVDPASTVSEAIHIILHNNTFDAFYRENHVTLNVNTRDLLLGKDIVKMNVRSFLRPISSLQKGDTIEKAVNILTHNRIRSAPVVKDDQIIGVVSAKDILKLVSELDNKWIKANQIFTANPLVIENNTLLSTARMLMSSKRLDHLPVVKKDKIVQVLTSNHILHTIIPSERVGRGDIGSNKMNRLEVPVGNLGTNRMASCAPLDDLNHILDEMLHADTTFCLVSLWDNLQGIITYRDILNLLGTKVKSKVPLFIVGMPKDDNAGIIGEKFTKILDKLQRVYPDIQEAKVYVKKNHGTGSRYNFEVSTTIITPHQRYMFSRSGYDLSKAFDEISERLMRLLSKRAKKRYKLSIRKISQQ
ncbi:MAG: CBS domain-containing protein [Nitrososphaerota archaeon]|nr:CBS domain-containing protein [Nitrososphaerota archaeon]